MSPPDSEIFDLDKRLALIEQAVTAGFLQIRKDIHMFMSANDKAIERIEGKADANATNIAGIKPFVESARSTWGIVWKALVLTAVAALIAIIAKPDLLIP